MPMTETELKKRDAQRDLGAELLESVSQMATRKGRVVMSSVISARKKSGLPQTEFDPRQAEHERAPGVFEADRPRHRYDLRPTRRAQ